MQITFDPLAPAEAAAVARFLNRENEVVTLRVPTSVAAAINAALPEEVVTFMDDAAKMLHQPTGTMIHVESAAAPSAAPLPPVVPSTAAADLFSTVPAVPTAGIPMPPGADTPPAPIVPQPPVAPTAPAVATANPAGSVELDKDGLPWNAEIHGSTKTKNADGRWRQRRNLDPAVLERVTAQLRALMAVPAASAVPLPPTFAVTATAPAGSIPTPNSAPAVAPLATSVPLPPPASLPTPVAPATAPVVTGQAPSATTAPVPASAGVEAGNAPAATPLPPATVPTPTPPVPAAPIAAAPTAPATGAPVSFPDLMTKITTAIAARTITEAKVHEVLQAVAGVGPTQIGLLAARADLTKAVAERIDQILAGGA